MCDVCLFMKCAFVIYACVSFVPVCDVCLYVMCAFLCDVCLCVMCACV